MDDYLWVCGFGVRVPVEGVGGGWEVFTGGEKAGHDLFWKQHNREVVRGGNRRLPVEV